MDPARWLVDHGDSLFRFAITRVRDRSVAEDLVQETLLAALKAQHSYQERSSVKTWLVGILKHKIIDYLRKSARESSFESSGDDGSELMDHCFDQAGHWQIEIADWMHPEQAYESDKFWAVFQECLGQLPEKYYRLFVLREFDGLAADEICNELGISTTNNVWVMLSRARMQLRECVGNEWFQR